MMGKLKVRAEARGLGELLASYGVPIGHLAPGADGWHSQASLAATVVVAATGPANLSRTHAKQVVTPWHR
jgi:hypothetical protein